MIGDRYLIDTVFGNKHGMLTIRPAPLTERGEPKAVHLVSPWSVDLSQTSAKPGSPFPLHYAIPGNPTQGSWKEASLDSRCAMVVGTCILGHRGLQWRYQLMLPCIPAAAG